MLLATYCPQPSSPESTWAYWNDPERGGGPVTMALRDFGYFQGLGCGMKLSALMFRSMGPKTGAHHH